MIPSFEKALGSKRPRIVFLSSYRHWPVQDGGHNRIFHLLEGLKPHFDVTVIAVEFSGTSKFSLDGPTISQISYSPQPQAIWEYQSALAFTGSYTWDLVATLSVPKNNDLNTLCERIRNECDLVILSRPFMFPLLKHFPGKPVVLDLHDIEIERFKGGEPRNTSEYLALSLETVSILEAVAISVCTTENAEYVKGVGGKNVRVIRNGAKDYSNQKRQKSRSVLFIGSGHEPNVEAVQKIYQVARKLPNYSFRIAGNVCTHTSIIGMKKPHNVTLLGFISEKEMQNVLHSSFAFLNFVTSGSGSSLKIAQALAAGLPIISTNFGMRGFEFLPFESWIEIENVGDAVQAIPALFSDEDKITLFRRIYAENRQYYSWSQISSNYSRFIWDAYRSAYNSRSLRKKLLPLSSELIQNISKFEELIDLSLKEPTPRLLKLYTKLTNIYRHYPRLKRLNLKTHLRQLFSFVIRFRALLKYRRAQKKINYLIKQFYEKTSS